MSTRVRQRDVNDTTTGVVEAALADERAAKLSRKKMHNTKSERGLNPPEDTRNLVGPNDHSLSQEMIAKAVKQRSLLRTENAARAHGVENLDATELAPEESDKETVFEPFNLEQERQEGYFEDDGTYQYVKNDESDEEKDAWLENVDVDQTFSTAVDQSAGVHKHKAVDESHDQAEMTDTEVAAMKKELCQYLQSGETVLSALKRLGRGGKARAGETFAKSGKKKTPEPSMMTADDKILFGKLTELSSALMSAGVYDVYNVRREEIERAAEVSGSKAGGGDESERRSSNDEATVPDGYVLDPQTGLFKNHESGLMYSPENGAFTDGEGKWWWYDEVTNCFVEWT